MCNEILGRKISNIFNDDNDRDIDNNGSYSNFTSKVTVEYLGTEF